MYQFLPEYTVFLQIKLIIKLDIVKHCVFLEMLWFFWTLPVLLQCWCSTCHLEVQALSPEFGIYFKIFKKSTILNEHPVAYIPRHFHICVLQEINNGKVVRLPEYCGGWVSFWELNWLFDCICLSLTLKEQLHWKTVSFYSWSFIQAYLHFPWSKHFDLL